MKPDSRQVASLPIAEQSPANVDSWPSGLGSRLTAETSRVQILAGVLLMISPKWSKQPSTLALNCFCIPQELKLPPIGPHLFLGLYNVSSVIAICGASCALDVTTPRSYIGHTQMFKNIV